MQNRKSDSSGISHESEESTFTSKILTDRLSSIGKGDKWITNEKFDNEKNIHLLLSILKDKMKNISQTDLSSPDIDKERVYSFYNPQIAEMNLRRYTPGQDNQFIGDTLHLLAHHLRRDRINDIDALEAYYKEDLIAEVAAINIASKQSVSKEIDHRISNRLDYYQQKLTSEEYADSVIKEANRTSRELSSFLGINDNIEEDKEEDTSNELDLQSTTPDSLDEDGNGIVDSQENYAADRKQGSREKEYPRHSFRR